MLDGEEREREGGIRGERGASPLLRDRTRDY